MSEPKLRFKRDDNSSYPEWREYIISDLFTKINNKNKENQNTNVITNSAEFGLIPQRDYFDKDIAVEGNTGNYTIIQTGDFVYNPRKSSYAPMGPFNYYRLKEDGIVSPLYSCLRPKGVLNPEYLLWYFQTDKWYGYVNDHGAQNGARHDRVGMTDKILMGIPVTAPCEEEQQRIADFLSSVDEVISASEEEVVNLETQKKAVMKKIFSQEVRFKKADGTDFPEWEEKTIDNLCYLVTKQTGFDYTATIKPALKKTREDAYPYLQTKNFSERSFNYETDYYMPCSTAEKFPKLILDTPLLLFSIVGASVGNIALFPGLVKCFLSGAICVAKFKDLDDIAITYYYMLSPKGQEQIKNATKGAAQATITIEDIRKFTVRLPSSDEREEIISFLSAFDEAIAAAKEELEIWKKLKKGLLQQMFV